MAKCRMKIPGSLLLRSLPAAEAERNPMHRVLTRHSNASSSLTPPGPFPGRERNRIATWKKSVRCAELFPVRSPPQQKGQRQGEPGEKKSPELPSARRILGPNGLGEEGALGGAPGRSASEGAGGGWPLPPTDIALLPT